MEILPSLSGWLSDSISYGDLTVRENTPSKFQDLPYDENSPPNEYQSVMETESKAPPTAWEDFKAGLSDIAEAAKSPGKVVDFLAKTVIDPTTYLPALKFGAFVGAFRPSNSKLLPSVLTRIKQELAKTKFNYEPPELLGKLSDKELGRYGTTEFLLDRYLPSTKEGGTPGWLKAKEFPLEDFLQTTGMQSLLTRVKYHRAVGDAGIPELTRKAEIEILRKANGVDAVNQIPLEPDIRAFRDQINDKKPIFTVGSQFGSSREVRHDIATAINKVQELVSQSKLTPEQLSKKSLQQLLGIADSVEKAAQKSVEAITDFTKQRTAELKAKQGFKNDLVELTGKNDFGAETEFLQHCVGAGGADPVSGKFLPKWHPITGEEIIRDKNFRNSAEIYWGLKERGSARYFSYRPEGLPVATVELGKDGTIRQFMAFKNEDPTPEVKAKVMEAIKPIIRKMKYGDDLRKLIPIDNPDIRGMHPEIARAVLNDNQRYIHRNDIRNVLMNGRQGAIWNAEEEVINRGGAVNIVIPGD